MALSHELALGEEQIRDAASGLRRAALERAVGNPNVAGFVRKSFRETLDGFGNVIVNFSDRSESAPVRVSYPATLPIGSRLIPGRVAIEIDQEGIFNSTFQDVTPQARPIEVVVDLADIESLTNSFQEVNKAPSSGETAYQH